MTTTKFALWYWDSRGAWREWGVYDNLIDATRNVSKIQKLGTGWKIEERSSKIINESGKGELTGTTENISYPPAPENGS